MILKLLPISLIQCALLTGGQVLMKYGLTEVGDFSFTWQYFRRLFTNWQFVCCGLCFSMAYPMVSLSYVMGMFAAIIFFHEQIPLQRWIGVFLILTGCVLIAR